MPYKDRSEFPMSRRIAQDQIKEAINELIEAYADCFLVEGLSAKAGILSAQRHLEEASKQLESKEINVKKLSKALEKHKV
jgi:molybdopterin-guanine dinucleotide biosynthesis protein